MASQQEITDMIAKLVADKFARDSEFEVAVGRREIFIRTNDQVFQISVSESEFIDGDDAAKAFMKRQPNPITRE